VLRHAGLVDFTQNGAQRCYSVSRPHLVTAVIAILGEERLPGAAVVKRSV
jgi:hypothetical protein